MPKIRDLGVKVIPETMRPPQIGPGSDDGEMHGGYMVCSNDCDDTTDVNDSQPPCPGKKKRDEWICSSGCDDTTDIIQTETCDKKGGGLSAAAAAQIRADLQQRLSSST